MSLEENSLRMSRKAKWAGGFPSPCGLGSLKANSIPSLKRSKRGKGQLGFNQYQIIAYNSSAAQKTLTVEKVK